MNIKVKNVLIISIIAIIAIIVMPNKANAGLQANKGGTSLVNAQANDFFKAIRRMETPYGTLGKNAQINDKYVDTTGNGIDCHMALNTEVGTAGILSYSRYGAVPTSANDSTTGNESGIMQLGYGKYEFVAGISSTPNSSFMNVILNADARYYNKYERSTSKAGDGMGKFGKASNYPYSAFPIIVRSNSGVLGSSASSGNFSSDLASRAVVVCGAGL